MGSPLVNHLMYLIFICKLMFKQFYCWIRQGTSKLHPSLNLKSWYEFYFENTQHESLLPPFWARSIYHWAFLAKFILFGDLSLEIKIGCKFYWKEIFFVGREILHLCCLSWFYWICGVRREYDLSGWLGCYFSWRCWLILFILLGWNTVLGSVKTFHMKLKSFLIQRDKNKEIL